jgi:hypothetical protein
LEFWEATLVAKSLIGSVMHFSAASSQKNVWDSFQHPRKAAPCILLLEKYMEDILSYFETDEGQSGMPVNQAAW